MEGEVEWCGRCLDITGETDASSTIQSCVDNAPSLDRIAYKLELPPGSVLLFEQGVRVTKKIHFDFNGSQVLIGAGKTGFEFVAGDSTWSKVENVEVRTALSQQTPDYNAVGFDMAHGVRLENIYCALLGTCVLADSTGTLNASGAYKNVNNIQVREFRATNCGDAFAFEGSDANAGFLYGLEITRCDVGINDSSSFGNHVFGAYIEVNREAGVVHDSLVNQSLYAGVIEEGADAVNTLPSTLSLVVGGSLPKYLDGESRAEAIGHRHGYATFRYNRGGVSGPQVQLGSNRTKEVLYWTWPDVGETERISIGYDEPRGEWILGWYGRGLYDGSKPFQLGGRNSPYRGNYQLGVEAP